MSKSWLYIIILLFLQPYATEFLQAQIGGVVGYLPIALFIDVAILAIAYWLIKNDPWVEQRSAMLFLTILMAINALQQMLLLTSATRLESLLALIFWSFFGLRSMGFKLIILVSAAYNFYTAYQMGIFGILFGNGVFISLSSLVQPIFTLVLSLVAVIATAYVNR